MCVCVLHYIYSETFMLRALFKKKHKFKMESKKSTKPLPTSPLPTAHEYYW